MTHMTPQTRIERATRRYKAAWAAWRATTAHYDSPEWARLHAALRRSLLAWERAAGVC